MLLSMVIFFCDHHFDYFNKLRTKSSLIIMPIKHLINWPIESTQTIATLLKNKQKLIEENKQTRKKLSLLKVKLQRLEFLKYENSQLRSLLDHTKQIPDKVLPAKLLTPSVNSFGKQIIINKGKVDGVYVNQPVLDSHGLLGQIISVDKKTSKVLLITNHKSAIPAIITRSGFQTIALGTNNDYLKLANIPETANVRTGDLLVTSNLGEHFPGGYHIGTIKKIKKIPGKRFIQVLAKPKADINKITHVLLAWPNFSKTNKR